MTAEPVRTWASAEAAEVWRQGAARRAVTLAIATERMLVQAGVQPGMRVLDIAAGTGDQSVLAARIVGPSGSVLATDISASMLDAAAAEVKNEQQLAQLLQQLEKQMREAAKKFEFERAAQLRDRIRSLKQKDMAGLFSRPSEPGSDAVEQSSRVAEP